ncbi:MAG: DUF305 domain-containing protein [Ferruginibacter sp.]|nr:DUF305 domain-containing protein [Ferruginibacter sp.]
MKSTILITAAIFSAGLLLQSCDNKNSTSVKTDTDTSMSKMEGMDNMDMKNMSDEMPASMTTMMASMGSMKMSGDFDLDFANMMIPHHQSAIDMAQEYLPKAKDDKIKTMAQNIIAAQKKEIEELKTIVANHKTTETKAHSGAGHEAGEHNELMETMNKMMDEMKGIKMSGNADKDFVMMMIPHHESAVTMAEDEISHGKNLELKKMAQKIMEDQNKEIREFQELLSKMN